MTPLVVSVLGAIVAGGTALACLVTEIWFVGLRDDYVRWRHVRFRLRLHALDGVVDPVALGSMQPSGELISHEALFSDDGQGRVQIPAGQRLLLENVAGTAPGDDGVLRIPADVRFWLLDAPITPEMPEASSTRARVLPLRAEGYTVTTDAPPLVDGHVGGLRSLAGVVGPLAVLAGVGLAIVALAVDAPAPGLRAAWLATLALVVAVLFTRVRATRSIPRPPEGARRARGEGKVQLVTLPGPLWVHGVRKADKWLLGPKREGAPHVLIIGILGGDDQTPAFNERIAGVSHVLAETIETGTNLTALAVAPVVIGRERRHIEKFIKPPREELAPWLNANYPGPRILIWGSTRPEAIDSEGYVLRIRMTQPPDGEEEMIRGTLPQIVPQVLAWVRDHLGEGRDPPAGLSGALPPGDPAAWLRLLTRHERIVLAKPESPFVPPPDRATVEEAIDDALAYCAAHGSEMPQVRLLAISMGIEATKVGLVDDARRARLLEQVQLLEQTDDAFGRLAPGLLLGLGERRLAVERAQRIIAAQGGAFRIASDEYGTWLQKIVADAGATPEGSANPPRT